MAQTLKITKIGNSKGVRLPAALLARYGFNKEIQVTETSDGLLLQPVTEKLSLEESFKEMAADRKAIKEAMEWAESGLNDGLEHDSFEGWPR